jgi:hypothetical protein
VRASLAKVAMSAVIIGGLTVGFGQPANAWVHGLPRSQVYWAPGPPPGPTLSLCYVQTVLDTPGSALNQGYLAALGINHSWPPRGENTGCLRGYVTAYSAWPDGSAWCTSTGASTGDAVNGAELFARTWTPLGCGLVGADFQTTNYWGYTQRWSVTAW